MRTAAIWQWIFHHLPLRQNARRCRGGMESRTNIKPQLVKAYTNAENITISIDFGKWKKYSDHSLWKVWWICLKSGLPVVRSSACTAWPNSAEVWVKPWCSVEKFYYWRFPWTLKSFSEGSLNIFLRQTFNLSASGLRKYLNLPLILLKPATKPVLNQT